jgi:hypothetical protein
VRHDAHKGQRGLVHRALEREGAHLKEKGMEGSIISKRILTKLFERMCTKLICLRIERINGLL